MAFTANQVYVTLDADGKAVAIGPDSIDQVVRQAQSQLDGVKRVEAAYTAIDGDATGARAARGLPARVWTHKTIEHTMQAQNSLDEAGAVVVEAGTTTVDGQVSAHKAKYQERVDNRKAQLDVWGQARLDNGIGQEAA